MSCDPVLRPLGVLTAIVGLIWALFSGMAVEAGSPSEPLAALGLFLLGLLLAVFGKKELNL